MLNQELPDWMEAIFAEADAFFASHPPQPTPLPLILVDEYGNPCGFSYDEPMVSEEDDDEEESEAIDV